MKESIAVFLQTAFLLLKFWLGKKQDHSEEDKKLEEEFNEIKKISDKKEKASRLNALFNRANRLHE